jgi:K+-sensing histidine kinase KdpD
MQLLQFILMVFRNLVRRTPVGEGQAAGAARAGVLGVGQPPHAQLLSIVKSLGLIAATTAGLFAFTHFLPITHIAVIYLIPVLIAATRWGTLSALTAAVSGFLAADFFFYPPLYSFVVYDTQHIIDLVLFLVIAIVTSNLAGRLKREVDLSQQREEKTAAIYAFSRRLAACFTAAEISDAIQDYLSHNLGRRVTLFGLQPAVGQGAAELAIPEHVQRAANAIQAIGDVETRTVVDPATRGSWLVRSVSRQTAEFGVVAIELGNTTAEMAAAVRAEVDTILVDAAATLEHLDLAQALYEAELRSKAEQLRDALVGSISHELRTPLVSILGSAGVLGQADGIAQNERLSSLVHAIRTEAERLDHDIQNLLDAQRITGGGIQPNLQWTDPADIVNTAVTESSRQLAAHHVDVTLPTDLPLIKVDSTLIERALGQLLENAAKYSPTGSTIQVLACTEHHRVVLSVTDQGIGLTDAEKQNLGKRSFRGQRALVPGSGLGLWIARAFVVANAGTIEIASEGPGHGTRVSISFASSREVTSELPDDNDD